MRSRQQTPPRSDRAESSAYDSAHRNHPSAPDYNYGRSTKSLFSDLNLKTKIWCYDHNYNLEPKGDSDGLNHTRTILRDPSAAAFVDGIAFHHYEGQPDGMTVFHNEYPTKPIHFSEGSVFSIYG